MLVPALLMLCLHEGEAADIESQIFRLNVVYIHGKGSKEQKACLLIEPFNYMVRAHLRDDRRNCEGVFLGHLNGFAYGSTYCSCQFGDVSRKTLCEPSYDAKRNVTNSRLGDEHINNEYRAEVTRAWNERISDAVEDGTNVHICPDCSNSGFKLKDTPRYFSLNNCAKGRRESGRILVKQPSLLGKWYERQLSLIVHKKSFKNFGYLVGARFDLIPTAPRSYAEIKKGSLNSLKDNGTPAPPTFEHNYSSISVPNPNGSVRGIRGNSYTEGKVELLAEDSGKFRKKTCGCSARPGSTCVQCHPGGTNI